VLSECRDRLRVGRAAVLLLDKRLERCRAVGFLKARGQQRTDSTHVLAAIRVRSRLEWVADTLRAALNDLVTIAPRPCVAAAHRPAGVVRAFRQTEEETRLPREQGKREPSALTVGDEGWPLLDALDAH
jgi:transposase